MQYTTYRFSLAPTGSLKQTKPLATFEASTDYVYDAQWSPTHPGGCAAELHCPFVRQPLTVHVSPNERLLPWSVGSHYPRNVG
jgi:hypothetical protein